MDLKQYQIVLVNLDPTIGSETRKTRPCVVISPDEMNKYLQTIIIAPMTTSLKKYPTRVEIRHNKLNGAIVLDQVRTVDKQRLVKILGSLTEKEARNVKMAIKEIFVD